MKTFKKCSCCKYTWYTRDEFLQDASIDLIGYQANFCNLELGLFLFNHLTCESTIAISAGFFKELNDGPVFTERLTGTEVCQGFCLDMDALDHCENQCECVWVRDIMQVIRAWPKGMQQLAKAAQG